MRKFVQIVVFIFFMFGYVYPQKPQGKVNGEDGNYVLALSAANHFLEAWRWRRREEEFKLLSDSLKHKLSEELQFEYLSGISNPHHEAYEICSGKWLSSHRISFQVQLFLAVTGSTSWSQQPQRSRIVMERGANNEWRVDELP